MICPNCGSNRVSAQVMTDTTTTQKTKGFGCVKAFIGYLFFRTPGLLCGLCGTGKGKTQTTTKSKVVHICQNCGKHF